MWNKVKIFKFIAMLLLLFAVSFTLSGCSKEGALPEGADETTLANEHKQCWQKEILTLLYDTIGKTAMETYGKITGGAMTLMMVAFAVWFAFQLLQHVTSLTAVSNTQIWDTTLKKLVLCFACGFIASSTDGLLWILNTIIFPIYNAFLEFGGKILETTSSVNENGQNTVTVFGEVVTGGQSIVCKINEKLDADLSNFPQGPRDMMGCMICAVNERLTLGNKIAFTVMKESGFLTFLVGLVLLVSFTILKLGFVFYLVDSIFKFAVMITMLPILVLSYPFGPTNKWAGTGMKSILSSAVFMMVIALMISVALLAVMQILQDHQDLFNPPDEEAEASLRELSPPILALLLIAFLVKATMDISQKLVGAIIGSGVQSDFQKKVEGAARNAGSIIMALISGGGSKIFDAVQKMQKVQEATRKVKESHIGKAATKAYSQYKKMQDGYHQMRSKIDRLAGRK